MFCFIIMAEQKERVYDMGNKEDYKKKIIEMVEKIENHSIIKLIYYYVQSGYNEEKAGK